MKYKHKQPKKYAVGGALAAGQLALGLGQSLFGLAQRKQANKALRDLEANRPSVEVSEATKRLADSPIAREQMDYERDALKRQTADSLRALESGGSKAVLGGVGGVAQGERMGTRDLTSRYEQARRNALSLLGQEQRRVQDINQNIWQNQVAAARAEKGAGQQNVFGGASGATRGLSFLGEMALGNDPFGSMQQQQTQNTPQTSFESVEGGSINAPNISGMFGGNPLFRTGHGGATQDGNSGVFYRKEGGKMPKGEEGFKTEGDFSHIKNPLYIVDKKGNLQGEATGNEYILNPEQMKKGAKESKFIRSLMKRFNKNK